MAAFGELRARFADLTYRSPAMLASWYGRNGLVMIGDFEVRAGYELSQDTVDRLGVLFAALRDDYLGPLEDLGARADAYLAGGQLGAG